MLRNLYVGRLSRCRFRRLTAFAFSVLMLCGLMVGVQAASERSAEAAPNPTKTAAGYSHSCAIRGGKAYCWGSNTNGELGNGTTGGSSGAPVAVSTSGVLSGKTLTAITAGQGFTCALDTAGQVYCWGRGDFGQLGNGSTGNSNVPVAVSTSGVLSGKTLTQVAAGFEHACAVDTAGAAYCWGFNNKGQLGNGNTTTNAAPGAVTTSRTPLAGRRCPRSLRVTTSPARLTRRARLTVGAATTTVSWATGQRTCPTGRTPRPWR